MSYMKRFMEDEIERLAQQYGKTWDFIHASLEYYDWDWQKVTGLLRAEAWLKREKAKAIN